jgi:photosynthetic reaction center cytochrome c subunit
VRGNWTKALRGVCGAVTLVTLAAVGALAQSGAAAKTAGEVYKNIKELKDLPADQLIPTMQFFAASLGVGCDFCHVEPRDKDDKAQKLMARKMIQMVRAINKETFEGKKEVTCYTCHRTSNDPPGTPRVADASYKPWDPDTMGGGGAPAGQAAGPAADQLLDKYIQGLGGAAALQKVASRVVKATVTDSLGRSTEMELFSKAPDKSALVLHSPTGDNVTGRIGDNGWVRAGNGRPRDIRPTELDDAKVQDPLYFIANMKQILSKLETRPLAKLGDRDAYQVRGIAWGRVPVRIFFGKNTGDLLRIVYLEENAIGQNATQIDFADYRDVGGDVRFPFRWTIARPLGYQTIQINQVQQNVPIDDEKFSRPAAKPAS